MSFCQWQHIYCLFVSYSTFTVFSLVTAHLLSFIKWHHCICQLICPRNWQYIWRLQEIGNIFGVFYKLTTYLVYSINWQHIWCLLDISNRCVFWSTYFLQAYNLLLILELYCVPYRHWYYIEYFMDTGIILSILWTLVLYWVSYGHWFYI